MDADTQSAKSSLFVMLNSFQHLLRIYLYLFRKSFYQSHFMFKNSFHNVICYSNIENSIVLIGKYVNIIGKFSVHVVMVYQ